MRSILIGTLVLSAAFAVFTPGATARPALMHFELEKSLPAADSTVHSASSVTLWFTQVPQENATSIRVIDAGGNAVPSDEVRADEKNPRSYSVRFAKPLAPGRYTVAWRSMAADGHVVRDEFRFTVMGH